MSSEANYNQPAPMPPHVLAGAPPPASASLYDSYAVPLAKVAPEPDIRTFQHTWIDDAPTPPSSQRAMDRSHDRLLWGIVFFPAIAVAGSGAAGYLIMMITVSSLGWGSIGLGLVTAGLVASGSLVAGLVSSVRGLQNGGHPPSLGQILGGVVGIMINIGLLFLIRLAILRELVAAKAAPQPTCLAATPA